MRRNIYFIILGFSLWSTGSFGQDIHFSQYLAAPLVINPALTGLVNNDWRASCSYRQQWASVSSNPYTTASFSFDMAMLKNKFSNGDAIGIGLLGYLDKAGSSGYKNTTIGISIAYHKAFGRMAQHKLSAGIQGVLVEKNIDFSKLTFEDQYEYGIPQNMFPETQEKIGKTDLSYPDFSAGITYSDVLENKNTFYCGLSWYHLSQPKESFLNGSLSINSRFTGYLGGTIGINENTRIYISSLYQQQGPAWELLYGGVCGFILNGDKAYFKDVISTTFFLGGWFRQRDAFAPYIGLSFARFKIGATYDITLFKAKEMAASQGGFEFTLSYNGLLSKNGNDEAINYAAPEF